LFKARAPVPVDPLDELIRIVNEAQERDAEDERRLSSSDERQSAHEAREGYRPLRSATTLAA
jgi:hypothetical protein